MERRRFSTLDDLRMSYHWSMIRFYRSHAANLINRSTPCSSRRLVALSNHILSHGIKVSRIWRGGQGRRLPATTDGTTQRGIA